MLHPDLPASDDLLLLTAEEQSLYEQIVPEDHFLRRLLQAVDFPSFRPLLATAYSPDHGRLALDPLVLLKLEILARHYNFSDREVVDAARFNVAYRLFLGLSIHSRLPHHTLLTYFRQRLGPERMQAVFDALVGQGRKLGLVKDRLRLKDATHIIANIAVPSTLGLVAEARDRLLDALRPCAAAGSRGGSVRRGPSSEHRGRQGRSAVGAACDPLAGRARLGRRRADAGGVPAAPRSRPRETAAGVGLGP